MRGFLGKITKLIVMIFFLTKKLLPIIMNCLVLLLFSTSILVQSVLLTNGTISVRNEKSIKPQSTFNQLIDRVPSNAAYISKVLNIAFGFYLVYTNLIDQGCTLPNGLKVPNGWENLYNDCQEKCVCRRNKFQCSASGCDLNYNQCTGGLHN